MNSMHATRVAIAVFLGGGAAALFMDKSTAAWLRYTTVAAVFGSVLCLVVIVVVEVIRTRAYKPAVREVPASNGIQVLDGFLGEDLRAFDRQYSIVRKIHGDDIASRLTREQIEAEYARYDRAETAASEDRCQVCDPIRIPADLLVEAWDERPSRERNIGEWLLCVAHAEQKIGSLRSTGATVVSEPMTAGYVDELTADHYGQGGVR